MQFIDPANKQPGSDSGKNLIVGKGIAGLTLAFRFFQEKIPFQIVDKGDGKPSSAVASGLINPVVVKHFGLSWMGQEFFWESEKFYRQTEQLLNTQVYYSQPIFRVFEDDQQINRWNEKRAEGGINDFTEEATNQAPVFLKAPYGGGLIHKAARVDVEQFFKATTRFFESMGLLKEEWFDVKNLQPDGTGWRYKGDHYDRVFFCQGIALRDNPLWNWLPVNPAKGQLVSIKHPAPDPLLAISQKIFVLPQGGDTFKVGATFEKTTEPGITSEAMTHLQQKFDQLIHGEQHGFTIVRKYYGFRPTVLDRKPLLGRHPVFDNLFFFNGLGSKGYMTAPWLSKHLYEHVFEGVELLKEVDMERYSSNYM